MNILKNGHVVDNLSWSQIGDVHREVYPNDSAFLSYEQIMKYLKGAIVVPVVRLLLLDEDENIVRDISEDFISGSLSCTYQTGQRRSMSVSLINKDGKYNPEPLNGLIWTNTKFRLDMGILLNDTIYWKQQGVFVLKDPSYAYENSNMTVSLSLCDKFGMFDGTVFGRTSLKTIIPVGVPIMQAMNTITTMDKGNGRPWDKKPIIFDTKYKTENTYYTIRQDAGQNMGENLTKMAATISCDVFYNVYGNLVVSSNNNKFLNANFPLVWRFKDGDKDLYTINETYNWSKMRNKVVVKGAVLNGYQFTATIKNENLRSPFCIQYNGEVPEYESQEKLYSDMLCQERAIYDLINFSRGVKSLSLSCGYNPFIDVNQSFIISNSVAGLNNENFVIDTMSIDCGSGYKTSITATNIYDVCF